MLLPDSLVYHGKALLKHFGNHILVADADILQIERLGMACLSTLPAPTRCGVHRRWHTLSGRAHPGYRAGISSIGMPPCWP